MEGHNNAAAASPGSLNDEVYEDLVAYQEFLDNRNNIIQELYGRKVVQSQLRDDLVRHVLIEFGGGKYQNISFYQKKLVYLGNHAAIRRELTFLERHELIQIGLDKGDRRANIVYPTCKLTDWYCTHLPRLYQEIRKFLQMREAGIFGARK